MTRRVGNVTIIEVEPPARCELCGEVAELRPYGPHGERICHTCGLKDVETTERMMRELMSGTLQ